AIGYFFNNRDKDIFQRDFESHFSIRRSTATQILKLMEQRGLIIRKSVENDARLKKIVHTDKALEIQKIIEQDIKKREKRLRNGLSKEEINTFFSVIDKLKANLEDSNA
ncbi:MAG: MarR family transcriptional regulator, partial [Clostridia bacterium]|nr:MarR family transcriptional regulator [Clostridia bacterium]